MSRISATDTVQDVFIKMCDGNPGGLTAMMDIFENYAAIDPQSMLGGLGVIMTFDDMGIYGTDIYVLWSDKCDRNIRNVAVLMRAVQLGLFPRSELVEMAKDQSRTVNLTPEEFKDLDVKVCEKLDQFMPPPEEEAA